MFELSVACKYLRPRWRQLSVSIISLISILVISLVVWLIVVFFSVTQGLEKRWVDKLIALTAPIRITPTEAYYTSYYHQIDSISGQSNYNLKTIKEKLLSNISDPYDPSSDVEIPSDWAKPEYDAVHHLKDPVKKAFSIIQGLSGYEGLRAHDYEASAGNLRLRLLRHTKTVPHNLTQAFLNQPAFLGSLDPENHALLKAILPISKEDIGNLLYSLSITSDNIQEDKPSSAESTSQDLLKKRLNTFFDYVTISELKTPMSGWTIPQHLAINTSHKKIMADVAFDATIDRDSLSNIHNIHKLAFNIDFKYEGQPIQGKISLGHLQIAKATAETGFSHVPNPTPLWFYHIKDSKTTRLFLPSDPELGEGILVPRPFKDAGVLLGDQGFVSFSTPTPSTVQEQRIKVFVAGFYDQGLIPIGGKFIIVNQDIANLIGASMHDGQTQSNGINVRFDNLNDTGEIKQKLQKAFNEAGIAPYWKIETYKEFDFTKDIIQQLNSDKHLFSLIAAVIIIVACSNIISMLIILVNDKKLEIGILRSMGASSLSIAIIFGFCGIVMGVTGSLMGVGAAVLTLQHLESLVSLLSAIQGHEAFNPIYYGDKLPNEISLEVLLYVVGATAIISLLSGLVPALKASLLRPSTILRSE